MTVFLPVLASADEIRGFVVDSLSKEPLIGANIIIIGEARGAVTGVTGEYSLAIEDKTKKVQISYIGYDTLTYPASFLLDNPQFAVKLKESGFTLQETIVTTSKTDRDIRSASSSGFIIDTKKLNSLPTIMGEADVIRAIQLTPGIQAANEGSSGFNVRGGASDQNLILFDNAAVFNPSHVLGIFSVFNGDVVREARLYSSGLPARFGGRLSSVLDIKSRDPGMDKFHASGSMGLISAKATISTPIVKEKLALSISARRSYLDQTLKPVLKPILKNGAAFINNSKYYFQDFNSKLVYKPNNKNKITLSGYTGKDTYSLTDSGVDYQNAMSWGNTLLSGNWYHASPSGQSINQSLVYSAYVFEFYAFQEGVDIRLQSEISDLAYKFRLMKDLKNHQLQTGFDYHSYVFKPNNFEAMANGTDLDFGMNRKLRAHEGGVFVSFSNSIDKRIHYEVGLRLSAYAHTGPYHSITTGLPGESDTIFYPEGDVISTYFYPEPRINIRYLLNTHLAWRLSYSYNVQYLHLASASTVTLPTDVWLPSTELAKPQLGNHLSTGLFYNRNKGFLWSAEVYGKSMRNQVELLYGIINNFQDNTFEQSMVYGNGWAYGLELLTRKTEGKLTGWFAYTISRTLREFDEINEGLLYPAKYDRIHDFNLVLNYKLTNRLKTSAVFVYATGAAFTIPEYKYLISGNMITGSGKTNQFRMPDYHRLDLSLDYNLTKKENYESVLSLSVYNLYNRYNPFYIYFEISGSKDTSLSVKPKQVVLMPVLPSLSWSFKF